MSEQIVARLELAANGCNGRDFTMTLADVADTCRQAAATIMQLQQAIRQLLSLHDDPCPYDAATTRAAARLLLTEQVTATTITSHEGPATAQPGTTIGEKIDAFYESAKRFERLSGQ